MKQCPRCEKTYSDEALNFCLDDGELLVPSFDNRQARPFDDSPPTVILDQARITNPINAPNPHAPPAIWQGQQYMANFAGIASPNQTLAIVSLCLGISSITVGWCCSLGLILSPAALITGFIALSQIKKDPKKNSGRGLALGGIVTGAIFVVGYVFFILIYGAAILFGGLNSIS